MHVVVLAGGLAFEREVSLSSGHRVCDALRTAGVETTMLDADATLVDNLTADRPDAVFIALHGSSGEDGALRGVLDLIDVPYVGSSAAACRVAWDKPTAKTTVRAAGLRTPDWVALPETTFRELGASAVLDRLVARFGLPLMVKPAEGGSALGVTRVSGAEELPNAMMGCFSYSRTVLIERYVEGVEVAVSVLDDGTGPRPLPAIEIVPESGVFDYAARYTSGMTTYHTPARIAEVTAERLGDAAVRTHAALGLRDVSRFDAIVTAEGDIQFLEVNVAPGMTETSLFPMAVAAAGDDLAHACAALVRRAADRSGRVGVKRR